MLKSLREAGLQMKTSEESNIHQNLFDGKTFVISGTFEKHSRDEIKRMVEQYGGKNISALSGKTSYLLAGDKAGPAKLDKAKKLGIEILSFENFLLMLK